MGVVYYVPVKGGAERGDWNPVFFADGTPPEPDWLTYEEWENQFPAPMQPPPSLEEARTAKIEAINSGYESVMAYVQAGYPDKEVLSWERQAVQARELQTDPDAEALFVRSLAATKGVAVPEMARRILANAESWEPIAAMLTAQRQLLEEAVWAALSVEEVEAVKVGYSV
ncbi:hypothetical protein LJC15_00140 [Desulfovibrio sp. OttesenSCG-928-G11]|nr:hypothetical protein [Desulfovibrio sp. OttesenSCG-928-G11]